MIWQKIINIFLNILPNPCNQFFIQTSHLITALHFKLSSTGRFKHITNCQFTRAESIHQQQFYRLWGNPGELGLLPRWAGATTQVSLGNPGELVLLPRWAWATQVSWGYYYPGELGLLPRWAGATQVSWGYYPGELGLLLPRWAGATTQVSLGYYPGELGQPRWAGATTQVSWGNYPGELGLLPRWAGTRKTLISSGF